MKLDGKSIQAAIMQLVEDFKFDPYQVLEIVKLGIKSGFKKDYGDYKKSDIVVNIENDGTVTIYKELTVVKDVEDEDIEVTLKEAKKIREDAAIGEKLLINVTPQKLELSRIASQSAAQTIKQNLKNIERERFYEKFQNKEGELLKARIIRVHADSVILDIEGTAVVLMPEGQIPNKNYEPGEEIFVLLKQISKGQGGITLEITQSSGSSKKSYRNLKKELFRFKGWRESQDKKQRSSSFQTTKKLIPSESWSEAKETELIQYYHCSTEKK